MPIEITVPRLGWSMDEGKFVRWLKKEGDWVRAGDLLFELEGEKSVQEIESLDEGSLRIPLDGPRPGDPVTVGQVIGKLLGRAEAMNAEASPPPPHATAPTAPTGPTALPRVAASPRARRLARELAVDWRGLRGTGRHGSIRERDVRAFAAQREPAAPHLPEPTAQREPEPAGQREPEPAGQREPEPTAQREPEPAGQREPAPAAQRQATIRRTIASRLVSGLQAMAPVTLTTRADASNLVALRKQFQSTALAERVAEQVSEPVVPTITDLIVKLSALALARHRQLNARWQDGWVVELPEIHIGIAVDTEAGLFVPVLRDPVQLGIRDVALRTRELIERARRGELGQEFLTGATFTVTNLGPYGIDAFTPIINPPEAAILGVGTIRREPVLNESDQVVSRERLTLSLTFDHRIVDGAPAARFLQSLVSAIENPGAWLIG